MTTAQQAGHHNTWQIQSRNARTDNCIRPMPQSKEQTVAAQKIAREASSPTWQQPAQPSSHSIRTRLSNMRHLPRLRPTADPARRATPAHPTTPATQVATHGRREFRCKVKKKRGKKQKGKERNGREGKGNIRKQRKRKEPSLSHISSVRKLSRNIVSRSRTCRDSPGQFGNRNRP